MNIAYNLNQYTQRTVPGIVPITGSAATDAKVSVKDTDSGQVYTTTRNGKYFKKAVPVSNAVASKEANLEFNAVKFDAAQDKDIVNTIAGKYYVAKTPQAFTYDDDGNMLTNGEWTYTWNGENRMVQAVKDNTTKIEFKYDYMGRRFEKKKYTWVSNAWQLDTVEKYVWNSYNIVAIYNASTILQKTMLYGLDINGGLQTAGGVGGLVLVNDVVNSKNYLPLYDGNGNVRVYLDSADNSVAAEYDYDPGTNFTVKAGIQADELAAIGSFSSMPYESTIKAFIYPIRIVKDGRFLSRDPMDIMGGVNLFNFVSNDIINNWDYLGLIGWDDIYVENGIVYIDNGTWPINKDEAIGKVNSDGTVSVNGYANKIRLDDLTRIVENNDLESRKEIINHMKNEYTGVKYCERAIEGYPDVDISPDHAYILTDEAVFPNMTFPGNYNGDYIVKSKKGKNDPKQRFHTIGWAGDEPYNETNTDWHKTKRRRECWQTRKLKCGEMTISGKKIKCKDATNKDIKNCLRKKLKSVTKAQGNYFMGFNDCKSWANSLLSACCLEKYGWGVEQKITK